MLRIVITGFIGLVLFSCTSSKPENKPLTIKEFLKLYKPADFPLNVADSDLNKLGDTTVDYSTFTQFIPDSAIKNVLSDTNRYII